MNGQPREDEQHNEQLRFYALLWWLRTGVLPDELKLAYVRTDKWVDIPVPTLQEIRRLRDEYNSTIMSANQAINERSSEARTNEETCRYCAVRQLCGEYWQSTNTLPLRIPKPDAETSFVDVRLSDFPIMWTGSGALSGVAKSDVCGEVSVFIGANKCPSAGSVRPQSAVLLGARLQREGERWKVTAPPASEVFWKVPT